MENSESANTPIADYLSPAETKDSKIVDSYRLHPDNITPSITSTEILSISYQRGEDRERGCLTVKGSSPTSIGGMTAILHLDPTPNLVILESMETTYITRISR